MLTTPIGSGRPLFHLPEGRFLNADKPLKLIVKENENVGKSPRRANAS